MTQVSKLFYCKLLLLVTIVLPIQFILAEDTAYQDPNLSKEILSIIAARQHPYLTQANFAYRTDDLDALYKRANYQLLWLGHSQSAINTADALDLLANAPAQGLVRENYDVGLLRAKYNSALALPPTAYKELALYDTALSITLLRFLHDMHYGRVDPQGINFKLQLREKKSVDLPTLIKDSLLLNTVPKLPLLVEPKLHQYQKLKSALAAYRLIAEKPSGFIFINKGKLRPGEYHPQLADLSKLLASLGDLPESDIISSSPEKKSKYTPELVEAVKKFQLRHGLGADGTLGPGTVEALNVPFAHRISQIELAMERLRWLPELSVGRSIIVNIPAFQLWAIDDIDHIDVNVTNMRVVVGKALKNQTPVLMAQMSYIEFSPYWNVPKNILKDEILPKLNRKPGFLASQNMEIVSNHNSAKPIPVSSDAIEKLKKGVYRVRQRPGKRNSLGKVKFIFPNKEDVYLHDTPANSLFSRSRRDFSHGCVRVENPTLLAEFALKNQGKWNPETIKKAMRSPTALRVDLQHPIPVLFFYTTSFVDQNDKLAFYPDIYGHDTVLMAALKKTNDLSDQSIFVSNSVQLPVSNPNP